ncbi:MAG: RNase adapter RapZ [Porticoccaceae bacterium]|nr:RNase adapter RapZ [Porticoccaceae bacterium]
MPRLVVVSGRSGSGKTSALNILEDVGFDCIDNLPPSLLPDLIKQLNSERINEDLRLAVGIDARNLVGDLNKLPDILAGLEASGIDVSVIFLQARRSDLIRRYSETRRKHPLSNETVSLPEAIDLEAKILSPILNISDRNIDTSGLSLHQLRDLVKNTIVPNSPEHMAILFESFGFKKGLPDASDFIFDVRCLPNPYWKQELRSLTGYDEDVIEFLESQVDVAAMLSDIIGFLTRWIPKFQANNRSYLTISIGCTGGQHRSVYIANRLQEYFSKEHSLVQVVHKELSV